MPQSFGDFDSKDIKYPNSNNNNVTEFMSDDSSNSSSDFEKI